MKKNTYDNIYFVGDIHGYLSGIIEFIKKYDIKNCLFIQVGDLGMGFHDYLNPVKEWEWLSILDKVLRETNNHLFAIRGNHDNPKFWNGQLPDIYNQCQNITLIPDYTTLTINKMNFLFIGGGTSIDRYFRREGRDYWSGECVEFDENKIKSIRKSIDIVITHVAPIFAYPLPLNSNHPLKDHNECKIDWDKSMEERKLVAEIYRLLKTKPKAWIYGHYHYPHKMPYDLTNFICAGEHDFIEINSLF